MKFTFTDMALLPNGTLQNSNMTQAMITAVFLNLVYVFVLLVDALSFVCSKRSINYVKSLLFTLRKTTYVETTKIPQHLAVIFGVDDFINLPLLCDFILYSAQNGVRQLTFYDSNGQICNLFDELEHFFQQSKRLSRQKVSFVRPNLLSSSSTNTAQSTTNVGDLQVYALSRRHGKELLADICAELSQNQQKIDAQAIHSCLATSNVYEVDFLVAIGCKNRLNDFPPWSLRLTEILNVTRLESYNKLQELEFITMLRAFSSRDRRMGY